MENLKNANEIETKVSNIVTPAKKVVAEKKEKLSKANISKFADRIKKFGVSESTVKNNQKSLLYNYPENFTSLQINGEQGKKFRRDVRNKVRSFADQITLAEKMQNKEKKISEIKNFNIFYKEIFKINDYSIQSLTHIKGEIADYYQLMLDIVKDSNSVKKSAPKVSKK